MSSYINDHRAELERRHYVLKATTRDRFFNVYYKKLYNYYRQRYEDNFCLIIDCSKDNDNAYIIPFAAVKALFAERYLQSGRSRWIGHVYHDRLSVGDSSNYCSVAEHLKAFENLGDKNIHPRNAPSDIDELIISEEVAAIETGIFDINNITDGRQRIVASIVRRRGQPKLRKMLLENYGGKCAITDCSVQEVLEVAHIIPYKGLDSNHPSNGLLLRADIHTLFDLGLLAIDTADMTVILAPNLTNTSYGELSGKLLRPPNVSHPSKEALDQHRAWAESQWQPNTCRRQRR